MTRTNSVNPSASWEMVGVHWRLLLRLRCSWALSLGVALGGSWCATVAAATLPQVHTGLRVMAPLQAGLWRATTEMTGQAPTRHEACSSVQDMDKHVLSLQLQDGHCEATLLTNESAHAKMHMRCAPLGTMEAVGVLEVTSASPNAYRVSLRMHNLADGKRLQSIQHFERLGACEH